MSPETARMEQELLSLFKSACRHDRLDVAELLLLALEKLDSEHVDCDMGERSLTAAYCHLIQTCRDRKF